MNATERAKLTLAEIITPDRWEDFTDWLEEAEDGGDGMCAHDQMDYEMWLRDQGETERIPLRASAIWNALEALGKGPCRCNAGAEIWRGNELDDVVFPLMYARPIDLPRALTGLPEKLTAEQEELYGKFYGARRAKDTLLADVPEPPFSGDVRAGLSLAFGLTILAANSRQCEPLVNSSDSRTHSFFHTASYEEVAAYFEKSGRPMVPFTKAFEDLAVYALRTPDGTPVTNVKIETPDGPMDTAVADLPHLVLARPSENTIIYGGRWHAFPAEGIQVQTSEGSVTLTPKPVGLHEITVG